LGVAACACTQPPLSPPGNDDQPTSPKSSSHHSSTEPGKRRIDRQINPNKRQNQAAQPSS